MGQVISLAGIAVMTRVFSPAHFGALALLAVAAALAATVITLRLEQAIVVCDLAEDSFGLTWLAMRSTLISLPLLVAIGAILAIFTETENNAMWWALFPLAATAESLNAVARQSLNRRSLYGALRNLTILEASIMAVSGIIAGIVAPSAFSLCVAHVLRISATPVVVWLIPSTRPSTSKPADGGWALLKKYSDYPKFTLPQALLGRLRDSALVFSLNAFHGAVFTGYYTMASRMLEAPLALLSTAVARVYTQTASDAHRAGLPIAGLTRRTAIGLALAGSAILIPLAVIGGDLFAALFGEEWKAAGRFVPLLLPWWLIRFVSSGLSPLPLIVGKIKPMFFRGLIYDCVVLAAVATGPFIVSPYAYALTFAIPPCLFLIYFTGWLLALAEKADASSANTP